MIGCLYVFVAAKPAKTISVGETSQTCLRCFSKAPTSCQGSATKTTAVLLTVYLVVPFHLR